MINGNACFAYFNKNWGIPALCLGAIPAHGGFNVSI
jgi:hypothetical protein